MKLFNKKIIFAVIFLTLISVSGVALAGVTNPSSFETFPALLKNIVTEVGKLIVTLGAIMIIVAGILYLTSAGNPGRMETAKKALTYAIVGIVIGLAASAIVNTIETIAKGA